MAVDIPTLLVLGGGSLARSVCYGLSAVAGSPLRVTVAARTPAAAAEICQISNVRASAHVTPARFSPAAVDLRDDDARDALVRDTPARGVLLCATTQSPWEGRSTRSAWTRLMARAGIGLSLPFHAELGLLVQRSIAERRPGAFFLNACFPDAVNPVLDAAGASALAGIGNVAVQAAAIQAALGLPDQQELHLLGHHLHLHEPADPADEAIAWYRGERLAVTGLLAAQRRVDRHENNQVTGFLTAILLANLLAGRRTVTHLPGPCGLPGGYPVVVTERGVELRLPPGITAERAQALNRRWSMLDGVVVDSGRVTFGPAVSEALADVIPELCDGFAVADLLAVVAMLSEVRERLRAGP
jgi:hypothetical protein